MKHFQIIKKILPWLSLGALVVLFEPGIHAILAERGWQLLILVMMIRPLSQVFPRFTWLRYVLMLRKELGIIAGCMLLGHGAGYFLNNIYNGVSIPTAILDPNLLDFTGMLAWGLLGMIVCIPLVLTSNSLSMKLLGKKWKWLQRLSYVLFISGGIHVILMKPWDMIETIVPMTVWLVLWILAQCKVVLWKVK